MPLSLTDLSQFTGSHHLYRHALIRKVHYTDGVKYLAMEGGAYWLIDEIAISQHFNKQIAAEEFQLWTLTVNADDNTAVLLCDDGNGKVVFRKEIPFTDFPLHHIELYFTNGTICLPSDY